MTTKKKEKKKLVAALKQYKKYSLYATLIIGRTGSGGKKERMFFF
jgi:hypothetical protein